MHYRLEIRLLGPFEVIAGGALADVGGSKRQALLAMLALRNGRVVAVDALVDGLWGEELPAAPRNALHHHVARLRAALPEGSIVGSLDGYGLENAGVDALRFEELLAETREALRDGDVRSAADTVASALDLWRGPALQGLPRTAAFSAEARRLEALHVDVLEEHFEVMLALGEHRALGAALRSALSDNPFRERLWGQLMLALYRSGRQADALETFQEARRVLADELGLEPGPDLRRLQEAILAHDPAIAGVRVDRRRGNLPAGATSFVGREDELVQVADLVREHRLVTLIGPPGVGKSRLGLESARSLEHEFPEGTWLVDFARAGSAADAVRLLASAIDVRGSDPHERVVSRLRHACALVVLDACEHVREEAARIVSSLLAGCREVRILATSRVALQVPSEVRVPVAPLGPPAVELFLERVRAARPGFEPDAEAGTLAAEIVRRLEGLPLAIELAAARANVLGLAEIVSILERRAELLRELPASDPSRTSLQALVEWSYDLLHGDEKTLLQQLAVHRGGASLSSLAAVAPKRDLNEATVAYLVGALVDKSIVSASFTAGVARYDMLDTVREYVLDRLADSGELAAAREAHAEHFAALAESARTGLRRPEWLEWMEPLELERDNLWAALAYARDAPDTLVAARLGVGLGWYFGIAERVSEGRAFVEAALASAEGAPLPLRIELLAYVCYLATEDDDLDAALEAGQRGVALASGGDAAWQTAMAQLALAFAYGRAGQHDRALALAHEARRAFDGLGDSWGAASSALTGALGALGCGDIATAAALTADAVGLYDDYDALAVPAALVEATLAERRGETEAAAAAYRRAIERSERAGFADHASYALTGLASVAVADGNLAEAGALLHRAIAIADPASESWAAAHARAKLAQVLCALGDAAGAATLYRDVVAWSEEHRRHQAREALFIELAGSPATAALLGLAEIADAHGDTASAHELRGRAGLALT